MSKGMLPFFNLEKERINIGDSLIFYRNETHSSQAKRSEKEQQEYQAFEQLVREAAQKKRETNKANNGHKTNSEPPETSSEYKPKTSESDERGTHT